MILDILAIFLPRISQFLNPSGPLSRGSSRDSGMGPEYIRSPVRPSFLCQEKVSDEFMVASWPFLVPPTVIPAPTLWAKKSGSSTP